MAAALREDEYRLVGRWPGLLRHRTSGRALDAEYGRLLVPARRDGATDNAIALTYLRVPAKRESGLPPLVVLVGGPGVAAIGAFESHLFDWAERASELCDVVTFDQRGCHAALPQVANPFRVDYDFEAVLDREGYLDAQRANARRLAVYWRERGVDLGAYNTRESAADVDDLRKALGAETINLHGTSYGSHLGLAVQKRYGDRVERAILCLVEGLDDTHKLPANTDRHFRHIADLAREDPALGGRCPDLYGELAAALDDFHERPATCLLHEADGAPRKLRVGRFALQHLLAGALGSVRVIAKLPATVRRLARRDLSTLAPLLQRWLFGFGIDGMMLAMDAAAGATAGRLARIEAQRKQALLDDAFNLPFPFIGDELGTPDVGDDFRAPVVGDTPTLLCSGTLDGRTPIANAEAARAGFASSHHIVVEGASHENLHLLQGEQMRFLRGEDVTVKRLSQPFAFDPLPD